jgi:hypothetical protein
MTDFCHRWSCEPRGVCRRLFGLSHARHGALIGLGIVTDFRFCGWDISDRFEQATGNGLWMRVERLTGLNPPGTRTP